MDRRAAYIRNFSAVKKKIQEAAEKANRDPGEIALLAASKRTDAEGVALAYELGHRIFGENRAQALRDKFDALVDRCPDAEWHFIGHLQKNKIKYIVGRASMVHTVDSLELAQALAQRMERYFPEKRLQVLVQVKMGNELHKTGCPQEQALHLCTQLSALPSLELCGLMLIPPNDDRAEYWFQQLSELAAEGRSQGLPLELLSMGMSGDLNEAVAAGSTLVRIGTALFTEQ
jgi:PLP dependent protein